MRRFARSLCATPEDAEEATQEALIVLYRKIGTLRATVALGSWMFQIVRRECMRRTRLVFQRPAAPASVEPSAEEQVLTQLAVERIVEAIGALPADQRAVLVLRDIQGESGAATARALGLSGGDEVTSASGARDGAPAAANDGEQRRLGGSSDGDRPDPGETEEER